MKKIQDKPERDTTSVSVRFKNSLLAVIDKLAARENRTRANAIETLVIEALDKREAETSK
jgi:metal-responsive CopG/Arc/MetJ family transcriptional regulator